MRSAIYFAILAVLALCVGIGLAEVQLRRNLATAQTEARAAKAKEGDDVRRNVSEMLGILYRGDMVIAKEIEQVCVLRLGGYSRASTACTERGLGYAKQLRLIVEKDEGISAGVVMQCMSTNRALSGIDWRAAAFCYERSMVALGTAAHSKNPVEIADR